MVSAHGLAVALEHLAALAPVPVRLTVATEGRLPEALEVAAYYVVSESLANVGKYAQASGATVEVARAGGCVLIEVTDDGVEAPILSAAGLRGLADRVEALGGRLQGVEPARRAAPASGRIPCAP